MERRSRGVALGALVAVLLTGCFDAGAPSRKDATAQSSKSPSSSSSAGAWQATDEDFRAVQDTLDARARAVLHHDEKAFVATLDGDDRAFVAAQKTVFDNLEKLGIERMSYEIDPSGINSELDGGDDPTLRPLTIYEHVQVKGVDQKPTANEVTMDFVRREGHWLLGADSMVADRSGASAPWSGDPITVSRRRGIVIVIDSHSTLSLGNVESLVSDGLAADAEELGIPAARDLLVDATTVDHDYSMSSLDEEGGAAAVTYPTFALSKLGDSFDGIAGWRISINPKYVGDYAENFFVVRHELAHFLLRDRDNLTPKWLSEGIADYVAARPYSPAEARGAPAVVRTLKQQRPALPTSSTFGLDPSVDYALAGIIVDHLVRQFGMPEVLALMDTYKDNAAHMRGTRDVDLITNRVLKAELGITEKELVAGVWLDIAKL